MIVAFNIFLDNVNIQIDGVLYLRVVEPYKVWQLCQLSLYIFLFELKC